MTSGDEGERLDMPPERSAPCETAPATGIAGCDVEFGEAVSTATPSEVYNALLGVWRMCAESEDFNAFPEHDGIEFDADGRVHFLLGDRTMSRRAGLDFNGDLHTPAGPHRDGDALIEIDGKQAWELQTVVVSECPAKLRLFVESGPTYVYAWETTEAK